MNEYVSIYIIFTLCKLNKPNGKFIFLFIYIENCLETAIGAIFLSLVLQISILLLNYVHGGLVAKLCLTLCDPMDSSPPGSSVHGISLVRILD